MLERTHAAILFPGQGSSVTDARALVERHCAKLHASACARLGADPLEHAELSTRFAQPAVFLASLAGWRAANQAGVTGYAFAGHSLGEITALTAAGVFEANEALGLVITRARLMDLAAGVRPGGMLAILKGSAAAAERLARERGVHVANYNAPGQTVLSGPVEALDTAARQARSEGLAAIKLGVGGAFHSPAMAGARDPFQAAVGAIARNPPTRPVLSSITALPFRDIPSELADALTAPVRWQQTIVALDRLGASAYLDVGPDRVLERLTARNLSGAVVIDREDLGVLA